MAPRWHLGNSCKALPSRQEETWGCGAEARSPSTISTQGSPKKIECSIWTEAGSSPRGGPTPHSFLKGLSPSACSGVVPIPLRLEYFGVRPRAWRRKVPGFPWSCFMDIHHPLPCHHLSLLHSQLCSPPVAPEAVEIVCRDIAADVPGGSMRLTEASPSHEMALSWTCIITAQSVAIRSLHYHRPCSLECPNAAWSAQGRCKFVANSEEGGIAATQKCCLVNRMTRDEQDEFVWKLSILKCCQ